MQLGLFILCRKKQFYNIQQEILYKNQELKLFLGKKKLLIYFFLYIFINKLYIYKNFINYFRNLLKKYCVVLWHDNINDIKKYISDIASNEFKKNRDPK